MYASAIEQMFPGYYNLLVCTQLRNVYTKLIKNNVETLDFILNVNDMLYTPGFLAVATQQTCFGCS